MSSRLPVEVNPFRLVEQSAGLNGDMPLAAMQRLQELLVTDVDADNNTADKTAQFARVTLDFDRTETGLAVITGTIETQLNLCCQRCLENLIHPLVAPINVVLVTTDAHAQRLQEDHEVYLIENDRLFLQDFVEDEILLRLPFSIMHDQCEPYRPYIEALPEDENSDAMNPDVEEARDNPFASLKDLKKDLQ